MNAIRVRKRAAFFFRLRRLAVRGRNCPPSSNMLAMVLGLRLKNSFMPKFATHTLGERTAVQCSAFCNGAKLRQRSLQEVSPADVGNLP